VGANNHDPLCPGPAFRLHRRQECSTRYVGPRPCKDCLTDSHPGVRKCGLAGSEFESTPRSARSRFGCPGALVPRGVAETHYVSPALGGLYALGPLSPAYPWLPDSSVFQPCPVSGHMVVTFPSTGTDGSFLLALSIRREPNLSCHPYFRSLQQFYFLARNFQSKLELRPSKRPVCQPASLRKRSARMADCFSIGLTEHETPQATRTPSYSKFVVIHSVNVGINIHPLVLQIWLL
jgi:hypothetical protein